MGKRRKRQPRWVDRDARRHEGRTVVSIAEREAQRREALKTMINAQMEKWRRQLQEDGGE